MLCKILLDLHGCYTSGEIKITVCRWHFFFQLLDVLRMHEPFLKQNWFHAYIISLEMYNVGRLHMIPQGTPPNFLSRSRISLHYTVYDPQSLTAIIRTRWSWCVMLLLDLDGRFNCLRFVTIRAKKVVATYFITKIKIFWKF